MDVTVSLGEVRERLGLKRSELARLAAVEATVIDALECDANEIDTAARERVLAVLGVGRDGSLRADWDALRALGLPLSGPTRDGVERSAASLNLHVRRAAEELLTAPSAVGEAPPTERTDGRHRDALGALVSAGRRHFPTATARLLEHEPTRRILDGPHDVGRRLKLARIAIAHLAEYL